MATIKFPFMNMQQMNLDWLLEHIGNMPEIIHVAALAGDDLQDVADMIDLKALEIPKGLSYVQCGQLDDPMDRQCICLTWKIDNDNLRVFAISMSANIGFWPMSKDSGTWTW